MHRAVLDAWAERRRGSWWAGLPGRVLAGPDLSDLDRLTPDVRAGLVLRRFADLDAAQAEAVAGPQAGGPLPDTPDVAARAGPGRERARLRRPAGRRAEGAATPVVATTRGAHRRWARRPRAGARRVGRGRQPAGRTGPGRRRRPRPGRAEPVAQPGRGGVVRRGRPAPRARDVRAAHAPGPGGPRRRRGLRRRRRAGRPPRRRRDPDAARHQGPDRAARRLGPAGLGRVGRPGGDQPAAARLRRRPGRHHRRAGPAGQQVRAPGGAGHASGRHRPAGRLLRDVGGGPRLAAHAGPRASSSRSSPRDLFDVASANRVYQIGTEEIVRRPAVRRRDRRPCPDAAASSPRTATTC